MIVIISVIVILYDQELIINSWYNCGQTFNWLEVKYLSKINDEFLAGYCLYSEFRTSALCCILQ